VISGELKTKDYSFTSIISYIEGKGNNANFRMCVGWVYPESLKDLNEMNRYADEMLPTGKIQIHYQNNTTQMVLLPLSLIRDHEFFKNMVVP
jgi:hypothetical protein